jgi:hypothetical protein
LLFHLTTSGPVEREVRALYRKADLISAVFQRDVVVMIGDDIVSPAPPPPPPSPL